MKRRQFFQTALPAAAGGHWLHQPSFAQGCAAKPGTVRERLWLFTSPVGIGFRYFGRRSVMSPAEGAFYLSVPNLIVVQYRSPKAPDAHFDSPFAQYALGLRPLKRVVWSIVGSGGFTSASETEEVLALAKETPNFVGIMLDDFFLRKPKDNQWARLSVEELAEIRKKLTTPGKDLSVFATMYTTLLDLPVGDYLKLIDVITLWSSPYDVAGLESGLKKVEQIAPKHRKMVGIYMADYSNGKGIPVDVLRKKTDMALHWLRQGDIQGIIFLGNTALDLGFESTEWAREWIQKVGDMPL